MFAGINDVLDTFAYDSWTDERASIQVHCFDDFTIDEIIALPSDIHMDCYRRVAQGGLIIEGGDETAACEIVKRIPNGAATSIDITVKYDNSVISDLPPIHNPYCNTSFAFEYVPPRIEEPRLPTASKKTKSQTTTESANLSGLAKCLMSAVEAVQLQLKFGGDASVLADYYAAMWNLPTAYFLRPSLGIAIDASEADIIASADQRTYLTYIDPAWQALVTSDRPALESQSFSSRAMINWERIFYLCRLQYLKGILETGINPRLATFEPMSFRVDAAIVHHYHPNCHALTFGPSLPLSKKPTMSLHKYMAKVAIPAVNKVVTQALELQNVGLLQGKVGSLQLVTPTGSLARRSDPNSAEIRAAKHRLSDFFSHDVYHLEPGIAIGPLAIRLIEKSERLDEVHVLTVGMLAFMGRVLESVRGLKEHIVSDGEGVHSLAFNVASKIGTNFGDSRVRGFLTAVAQDTVRDRSPMIERAYTSTFGKRYELPIKYGFYGRLIQMIAYSCIQSSLRISDHRGTLGAVYRCNTTLRSKLHNGVVIGTPRQLVATARHSSLVQLHHELLDNMRRVYGGIIEHQLLCIDAVRYTIDADHDGLAWVRAVLKAKRGLLGCLRVCVMTDGSFKVISGRDEERRVVISFLHDTLKDLADIKGSVDDVWRYARIHVPSRPWCQVKHAATKVTHPRVLQDWFNRQLTLHQQDHDELTRAAQEIHHTIPPLPIPAHIPVQHNTITDVFANLSTDLPEMDNKARMWDELLGKCIEDSDLDYLLAIEYDSLSEEDVTEMMQILNEVGVSGLMVHLKGGKKSEELR